MFVGATMRDGPVGPGRLPEESTARSGFRCSGPELEKGRITDVYETLSPLEAGSGVSIIYSSLSLKGGAARACKQARRSPRRSPPRTARVGTVRWDRTHSPQAGECDRACESMVRRCSRAWREIPCLLNLSNFHQPKGALTTGQQRGAPTHTRARGRDFDRLKEHQPKGSLIWRRGAAGFEGGEDAQARNHSAADRGPLTRYRWATYAD